MNEEERAAFQQDLSQRRGIFPDDERIRWCMDEYWQDQRIIQHLQSSPEEREALEQWLKSIQKPAGQLLQALLDPVTPPLESGRFFQTFAGGISMVRRFVAGPVPRNFALGLHYGHIFLTILEDLARTPHFPAKLIQQLTPPVTREETIKIEGSLVLKTFSEKKKRGGKGGDSNPPIFSILCARLVRLLQENGSKKGSIDDLFSLLRYWRISYPGIYPTPEGKETSAILTHLRKIAARGRRYLRAHEFKPGEIKKQYYEASDS